MGKAIRFIIAVSFLCATALTAYAQKSQILSERIHTLQVRKNGDWQSLPVITLGTDDRIEITFDEFSHDYQRLTYNVRHFDADWKESGLLESEYMEGFNDLPIQDYANSINTTFLYTNYFLELPNDDVKLLVSGNYEVTITDDENHEELLKARFSVLENIATVDAAVSGITDIDNNQKHQQLTLNIDYQRLPVNDPQGEIIVRATQNRRQDVMTATLTPSYVSSGKMQFQHNRHLIFKGGNEFRRFEIISMYNYTQHVDKIDFYDPYFHATLIQDQPMREYRYDQDHNGRYIIRYDQADNSDIEADYLLVHFSLKVPEYSGGRLYLDGDFTDGGYCDKWQMEYNRRTGCYEKAVLLKMGSYDYRYLWVPEGPAVAETSKTEGDSFETANEYQIYVWFRQHGARYDRLVGLCDLRMTENQALLLF